MARPTTIKPTAPLVAPPTAPLVALPAAPPLTQAGRDLIYEFETGGRSGYNPRPEWPRGASGVTVGIGYDCGYNSRQVIIADWAALPNRQEERLAATAGVTGRAAQSRLAEVRDIVVTWDLAGQVFDRVTVSKFWQLCERTYPGFDALHPNAQAAILSLTFNRGSSLVGERRKEMLAIKQLVPKQDYRRMAGQIRAMERVWRGTEIEHGMTRRREAEARLLETAR